MVSAASPAVPSPARSRAVTTDSSSPRSPHRAPARFSSPKLTKSCASEDTSTPSAPIVGQDGAINPQGFRYLTEFRLEGAVPVWTYTLQNAQLEKRLWMQHGANTTYVEYRLVQSAAPLELECKILVNYRDFNNLTHANGWRMQIDAVPSGLRVTAFDHASPFYLRSAAASAELARVEGSPPGALWYCNYEMSEERDRGLEDCEDHLYAATFRVKLNPGATASLVFSTDANSSLDATASLAAEQSRERDILSRFAGASRKGRAATRSGRAILDSPARPRRRSIPRLLRQKSSRGRPCEIIAGYPWFGVWSRDAMISLPGLTLATGRPELARQILRTFAQHIDRGMLPNFFPDSGQQPEFNSADAPLWFIEALRHYVDHTGDLDLVRGLFPSAQNIISVYSQGTRYSIHVDPSDGLVHCGEPGTQLTWMDARVNGVAATPRMGKPVEINALWLNALATAANLAPNVACPRRNFSARPNKPAPAFHASGTRKQIAASTSSMARTETMPRCAPTKSSPCPSAFRLWMPPSSAP